MAEGSMSLENYEVKGITIIKGQQQGIKHEAARSYRNQVYEFEKNSLPLSSQRKTTIKAMTDFQKTWIKERFGLDISARQPNIKNIKYFTKEQFDSIGFEETDGKAHFIIGGVWVVDNGNESETMEATSHELAHLLGGNIFALLRKPDGNHIVGRVTHEGYANAQLGTFHFFNEAITELFNLEMLNAYRKSPVGKDYIEGSVIQYGSNVLFWDILFEEMGQRLDMSDEEIRYIYYRGYLEGSMKPLKLINDVFGKNALKLLSTVREIPGAVELRALGDILGLPQEKMRTYVEKCNRYFAGEEIQIMRDMKIKSSEPIKNNGQVISISNW